MKSSEANKDLYEGLQNTLKARAAAAQDEHSDAGDLAAFFYGKASKPTVAAHLAICSTCKEEIALYAKAERAAVAFKPNKKNVSEVPAAARELIRDWEESAFAKPKTQSTEINADLLAKLAKALGEHQISRKEQRSVSGSDKQQVTVFILTRSGEIRGTEIFACSENKSGEVMLKCADTSARFNSRKLHALLHQDGKRYTVESYSIERNRVRVGKMNERELAIERTHYFIIED
ncbi:MAG: hypothetical protein AB1757_29035 [Acidobacteriota bacterium]